MKEGNSKPSKPVAERDCGGTGAGAGAGTRARAGKAREVPTVTGRNPVIEALRSGRPLTKIMIAKGVEPGFAATVKSLAREAGVPVVEVERGKLDAFAAGQRHQGVVAVGAAARYCEVDDLLERAGESALIVVLDGIEDPRNLGAIIRTCDAVGATGVIVPKRRACGLTSVAARASAGAVEYVPCARAANLPREVEKLKERGFWVFGADAGAERTIYEVDFTGPVALVIGSEGRGISRLLAERCDFLVRIPTLGRVSSLNASVAAAVIMFEVLRQRGARRAGSRGSP
ncbi:MAG: 23S rRNA (guanosine(2251)-2'-O)-methyltransferase RlmB [Firmicutes bacterium]|nr:23S rRNA (guanosine(2251)-2'-O)-methyltransferase RlmB [Bacillota bacterium]